MKILILGDSWGYSHPEPIDSTGHSLENIFLLEGYTVFNKSIYGGSNIDTLNLGLTFLNYTKNHFQIDLIVWFSTELSRDKGRIDLNLINSYKQFLNLIHEKTWQKAIELKNMSPKTKWVIIGGHTALYNADDYEWADLLITDWKLELLGFNLPKCQFMSDHDWIYTNRDRFKFTEIENELNAYEKILDIQRDHKDIFIDGVHVSGECYATLANRLLNWINNK